MEFPGKVQNKYALFIVNTYLLPNALNDVLNYFLLCRSWGIEGNKITILIDRPSNFMDQRLSALRGFGISVVNNNGRDFVSKYISVLKSINARSGGVPTALFISISGHGSQIRDRNGDEPDGFDERIFPNGVTVVDDDLNRGLTNLGSNFYVLTATDTCHSGTMFDLRFTDAGEQRNRTELKCLAVSLSACADNQVDWEVGCASSKLERFIPNSGNLQGKTYLNILRRNTITGALTAGLVSTSVGGISTSTIQPLSGFLRELGQRLVYSSSVPITQIPGAANRILINDIKNNKVKRSGEEEETVEESNSSTGWIILVVLLIIFFLAVALFVFGKYTRKGGRRIE